MRRANVFTMSVLPVPGTPSTSTWPPENSAIVASCIASSSPTTTRPASARSVSQYLVTSINEVPPLHAGRGDHVQCPAHDPGALAHSSGYPLGRQFGLPAQRTRHSDALLVRLQGLSRGYRLARRVSD